MLDRSRFVDKLPEEAVEGKRAVVVGCGNVGSFAALWLARMGLRQLRLVDPDKVGRENLATQAFGMAQLEVPKPLALAALVDQIDSTIQVDYEEAEFEPKHLEGAAVVVAALDSIKVREQVFTALGQHGNPNVLLVDPRTSLEEFQVHSLSPVEGDWWLHFGKSGFPKDNSLPDEPCGARTIAFTGGMVGGCAAQIVRWWLCGEPRWGSWYGDLTVPAMYWRGAKEMMK